MTVKQTLNWGLAIVGGTLVIAFAYYEIRLQIIYANMSSVADATAAIQNPNLTIVAIYDPTLDVCTDDSTYQYSNAGTDELDAVQINGVIFTGDSNTQVYADPDGNVYDGNADTITDTQGNVTAVDPSTVTYGTIDSNNNFSAD